MSSISYYDVPTNYILCTRRPLVRRYRRGGVHEKLRRSKIFRDFLVGIRRRIYVRACARTRVGGDGSLGEWDLFTEETTFDGGVWLHKGPGKKKKKKGEIDIAKNPAHVFFHYCCRVGRVFPYTRTLFIYIYIRSTKVFFPSSVGKGLHTFFTHTCSRVTRLCRFFPPIVILVVQVACKIT